MLLTAAKMGVTGTNKPTMTMTVIGTHAWTNKAETMRVNADLLTLPIVSRLNAPVNHTALVSENRTTNEKKNLKVG